MGRLAKAIYRLKNHGKFKNYPRGLVYLSGYLLYCLRKEKNHLFVSPL